MSFSGTDGGSGRGSSDAICQVFRTSARKNRHRTSATGHRGLAVQHLGVASARGFCSCVATAASTGNVLILSPFSLLVSLILPSCVPNFISPRGTVWTFEKTLFCVFFFFFIYPFYLFAEMPDGRAVDFASLRILIILWTNSSRGFVEGKGA